MRLYHRTTAENAEHIYTTGRFVSAEGDEVCLSDRRDGHASAYGPVVVVVNVPAQLAMIDDEFPDGEKHYRVRAGDIRPEWVTC